MFKKINLRVILQVFILVLPLSILFLTRNASAIRPEQAHFGEIDNFIQERMRVLRIPGLAFAVVQGDRIVHIRGYGLAGPEMGMTPDTRSYIGSVSKPITALAVIQLVEQGDLQLDHPVQEYLPWFQVSDPEASATITVRNLLNHASGLSEVGYFPDLPVDATLRTAVEELRQARLIAQPGAEFHYFNENYQVLGLLVETISGLPYGQYVQENIFTPLDMENSFADPVRAEQAGVAQGHGVLFGFPISREEAHPIYETPSGRITSTAEDMAHFLIAQLNGGRY